MDIATLKAVYTADTAPLDAANQRVEQGFNRVGTAADNASAKTQSATTEQTSALNKVQAAVSSLFNKYDTQLAKLGGYDSNLRQLNVLLSQEGVGSKIDQTTAALLREKAASVDAQRAAIQLGREQETAQKLAQTEADKTARAQVKAASDAERAMTQAARASAREWANFASNLQNVGGSLQTLGAYMSAAITAPLVGGAIAAEHYASSFQTSMGKVRGLTDSSAAEVDKLQASVLELSTKGPQGAKELADGLFFVVSAGFKGDEAMKVLTASSRAAAAGLGDTKTVADAVTSTLNAYKQGASEAGKVTDILTNAVVQGKVAADQLAPAIGRVLPIAAAAHIPFEQVAASLATMTRVGLNADEAATALRATIGALEKPSAGARKALEGIGLSSAQLREELSSKGLLGTLQELMAKTGGNIDVIGKIIPNIRALTGVLATAGSQSEAYKNILDSMGNSAGKTDKAFGVMSQTIGFQVSQLQNVVIAGAIQIGNRISTVLSPVIAYLTANLPAAINATIAAFDSLSPVGKTVALVVTGIAAAIGPVLAILGTLTVAVGSVITSFTAIAGLAGAIGGLSVIAPVILGIGAAIASLSVVAVEVYAAWTTNFGGIRDTTLTVWEAVKSATNEAINFVLSTTKDIGGGVVNWWKDNYNLIQQTVTTVSDAIKAVTSAALSVITGFWKDNGGQISSIVKQTYELAKSIVGSSMTQIGNVLRLGMQLINGDWAGAWETTLKLVRDAIARSVSLIKGYGDLQAGVFSAIITTVVKYGTEFFLTMQSWTLKAVEEVAYIIATLPIQIYKTAPAFVAAGKSLAQAIWEGIKQGLTGANGTDSVKTALSESLNSGNFNLDGLSKKQPLGELSLDIMKPDLVDMGGKVKGVALDWNGVAVAVKGTNAELDNTLEKHKKIKEVAMQWTSASLAEFARNQGMTPLHGFETTGHNSGSKHYTNQAEDVRTNGVPTEQLIAFYEKALKAGIRVVDERVRPPGQKAWGGANAHLEENDKEPSYFNPALDYGGHLEQLKALDYERINGHIKNVAQSLSEVAKQANPAAELLGRLQGDFDQLGTSTKVAEVALQLADDKFKNLTPSMRAQILATAQLFDNQEKLKGIFENLTNMAETPIPTLDDLSKHLRDLSFDQINKDLADPAIIDAINRYAKALGVTNDEIMRRINLLRAAATSTVEGKSDILSGRGFGGEGIKPDEVKAPNLAPPPPPPVSDWVNFWDTITKKLTSFKAGLPSMKSAMGEIFIDLPNRMGEIFSNAVSNWDGTFKGFFKSIGQGFADLMKQIAAELIKMLVIKAFTNLFGSMFGGGLGGLGGGSSFSGFSGGGIGMAAEGGYIDKPTIVGEKGWELFVPHQPGTVVNQKQLSEIAGKGGNVTNNYVNISTPRGTDLSSPKSRRQLTESMVGGLQRFNRG